MKYYFGSKEVRLHPVHTRASSVIFQCGRAGGVSDCVRLVLLTKRSPRLLSSD